MSFFLKIYMDSTDLIMYMARSFGKKIFINKVYLNYLTVIFLFSRKYWKWGKSNLDSLKF